MTLQKIEFMYDIPDGYRFVKLAIPKQGEMYLNTFGKFEKASWDYSDYWIIVEEITEQEQPSHNTKRRKHADLIHAWADGAEIQYQKANGLWDCVFENRPTWSDCEIYRIKPKTKTIRFRNFLHSIGNVLASNEDISDRDYFVKWLGEWQEFEVEE